MFAYPDPIYDRHYVVKDAHSDTEVEAALIGNNSAILFKCNGHLSRELNSNAAWHIHDCATAWLHRPDFSKDLLSITSQTNKRFADTDAKLNARGSFVEYYQDNFKSNAAVWEPILSKFACARAGLASPTPAPPPLALETTRVHNDTPDSICDTSIFEFI